MELKSDQKAHKTGNIFWETAIIKPNGTIYPGWGTSISRFYDYFLLYSTKYRQFLYDADTLWDIVKRVYKPGNSLKKVETYPKKGEIKAKGVLIPIDSLEFCYPQCTFTGSLTENAAEILNTIRLLTQDND